MITYEEFLQRAAERIAEINSHAQPGCGFIQPLLIDAYVAGYVEDRMNFCNKPFSRIESDLGELVGKLSLKSRKFHSADK
jgi:hypothetical protein